MFEQKKAPRPSETLYENDTKPTRKRKVPGWEHVGDLIIRYGKPCRLCGKTRKVVLCDDCYGHGRKIL